MEVIKVNRRDMSRFIELNKSFEEEDEEFDLVAEYINNDLEYK